MDELRQLSARVGAQWRRRHKTVERVVQLAVPVVLLAFIVYSLDRIGLSRVWQARPSAFLFYFVLLIPFFLPALGDSLIYRRLLGTRELSYAVFLRKQCLNSFVLDLSGDAYFFLWCRRKLALPTSVILHAIKDSNILSATASFAVLCIAVVVLAASGTLNVLHLGTKSLRALGLLGVLPVALTMVLVLGGRRVTTLARREMAVTFATHLTRAIAVLAIRFLMWEFSDALPNALACLEFVTLGLVISRIPVVPNKALIYAGAAIVAAGALKIPEPGVAAVVVIENVAGQLANMAVIVLPWLGGQVRTLLGRASDGVV